MKKYIQEATNTNIWTSLRDNTFNRAKDIEEFIAGLELIDENTYISLDAKWGEGKTFFVRQVEEILKYLRARMLETEETPLENLESHEYLKNSDIIKKINVKRLYLPIYYNAWMYDDHNDPLMSLILVMTKQCSGTYNTNVNLESLSEKVLTIAEALPVSIKKVNPAKIVKSIKGSNVDILEAVKTEEEIKKCVRNIFDDLIVERTEKLVVFIDELDRCKPSFAIEMLERIKHYFDDERIIFVVSLNKEQLIHTISNYYGTQFDATRYLNRFFDISINLPEMSSYDKQRIQCYDSGNYWLTKFADELSNYYNFSLRDKLIYKSRIEAVDKKRVSFGDIDSLLLALFVAIVIALDMIDVEEKEKFLNGKSDFIGKEMPQIGCYKKYILRFFVEGTKEQQEQRFEEGHKIIQEAYWHIFAMEDEEYYDKLDINRGLKARCIKAYNGVPV